MVLRRYVKTDDDSLMHLPRIEADLLAMEKLGRSHYYYGVMTWRPWIPRHTQPDGVCGSRGDDGPSMRGPSRTLRKIMQERQPGGPCESAIGPFPFADGSLQAISSDLLRAFVTAPLTLNFSSSHLHRETAPFWTHEDAGVGYLIFHVTLQQALPPTYLPTAPCVPTTQQLLIFHVAIVAGTASHVRGALSVEAQQVLAQLAPRAQARAPRRPRGQ